MSEKQRSMNGGEAWISRQARTTNYSVSIFQLRFVRYPRTVDTYIRICIYRYIAEHSIPR